MEKKVKVNLPILVVTLLIAVCLIVTGIVIETSGGRKSSSGATRPSSSTSSGSSSGTSSITIYEDNSWRANYQTGKELTFKFTPEYTDEYYIRGYGITIDSIKKSTGGSSLTVYNDPYGAYDVSKSVYLTGDTTYVITVTVASSSQYLIISAE